MAERRGRVGEQVGRHIDRATRSMLATPDSSTPDAFTQLENVAGEAWRNLVGRDGFLPVLLLMFLAMILPPMIGASEVGMIITLAVGAAALIVTVFRSTHRRRIRQGAVIYTVVATIVGVTTYATAGSTKLANHDVIIVELSLILLVLLAAFPLVLIRAFQHRRVTVNTVCATLAAYLLIGLIFTTVYRICGQVAPPFFTPNPNIGTPTPGDYSYFSFITLTTVGFGDFTAGSDSTRALVMIEAVIGQVFLVTMLARVVGMLGVQRRDDATAPRGTGSGATTNGHDEDRGPDRDGTSAGLR